MIGYDYLFVKLPKIRAGVDNCLSGGFLFVVKYSYEI
jgi:hypothetical protein